MFGSAYVVSEVEQEIQCGRQRDEVGEGYSE